MQAWMDFFVLTFRNCINYLDAVSIFGVSVLEFIVATFIMGVILRAILYRA